MFKRLYMSIIAEFYLPTYVTDTGSFRLTVSMTTTHPGTTGA